MIRPMVYTPETGLKNGIQLDTISDLIQSHQNLVWLGVIDPTPEDMKVVSQEFKFHPLALEDAFNENQRPKIDEYEGYIFLINRWISESADHKLESHQLALFIGPNYVVTIHQGDLPAIKETIQRVQQNPDLMRHGIGFLVYFIMDAIVDSYFPLLDEFEDRLDEMERQIFEVQNGFQVESFFHLKRDLLTLRKVVSPLRDALNVMTRQESTLFTRQSIVYFQDVYDHVLRINDMIDTYRDILTTTMDAYLSITSNRLNSIMKTLTIVSTLVLPLALITGIYGMNFDNMPELHYKYGYYEVILCMVLITAGMGAWFKRKGWW